MEWQKIETAPNKPGFYLALLPGMYGYENTIQPAYFGAYFKEYENREDADKKWCRVNQLLGGDSFTAKEMELKPTHWMPLPKAPE